MINEIGFTRLGQSISVFSIQIKLIEVDDIERRSKKEKSRMTKLIKIFFDNCQTTYNSGLQSLPTRKVLFIKCNIKNDFLSLKIIFSQRKK